MGDFKETKVYTILKRLFFICNYLFLMKIGTKNRKYFFSKWVSDNGDNSLLIRYPLNPQSIVVDVGGYTGNFSDKILSLYNPQLIILEPVGKYFKILREKYSKNKNVSIYKYGLSNLDSNQKIFLSDDGTSLFKESRSSETIKLMDSAKFFKKYKKIDLVSINIEGAEFDVLERLIETGTIKKIKNLQVQFHSIAPDAEQRRKVLLKKLSKTHSTRFSYPFVWESFSLKTKPFRNKIS